MGTPYYQDNMRTIYNSDCRSMAEIPDDAIQCCVTSPPYWGLRKYAAPDIVFGDGWRGQFGLEPAIDQYIEHTIEIMREIRRVLRPDGVLFWNIADSYVSGKGTCYNPGGGFNSLTGHTALKEGQAYPFNRGNKSTLATQGLKPKDLALIPFRVALAAQSDGWWVRSDIIWNKSNPMPESVQDRPTDAYEHIFMFTKSERYYWDIEAVRETKAESTIRDNRTNDDGQRRERNYPGAQSNGGTNLGGTQGGRNIRNVWTFPTQGYPDAHFATFPEELPERCIKAATREGDTVLDPFAGSGTTLLVAARLGRRSVGYEISPVYCDLIVKRNNQHVLVATGVEAVTV
ncbi:MAG: DNA-methyltransferase [Dehalogenimonas sp.]